MTSAHPRPRVPARRLLRPVLAATLVVVLVAGCSSGTDPNGTAQPEETSTTTTTALPGPVSDQTPPKSLLGMIYHDDKVWVADFLGGQVLAIDPNSGAILRRLKSDEGVPGEVSDVAVGADGSVYWTGFNDGQVARLSPANINQVVSGVEVGASGIAFSHDGKKLYVGRAIISDGLWGIDPEGTKQPVLLASSIGNMRSFDVGADGLIYGPQYGLDGRGALARVDPATGEATTIVGGFSGPISAKLSPDGTIAYVLSLPPGSAPELAAVDLATATVTPLPAPQTPLVGGMAVAPDGRIFVSAYNEPVLNIISPDGSVKTIGVGRG